MGLHPRYAVAVAVGVVLAMVATLWAISESRDRIGLDVADLVRVEAQPDPSTSRLNDQLDRYLAGLNGDGTVGAS